MPADDPALNALTHRATRSIEEAEARGKLVLLYQPEGVLGGIFTCARCGAVALQPDLLVHPPACNYAGGGVAITVW